MSDSFFGFDTTLGVGDALEEGGLLSDDEGDYDALNDETFGDGGESGDWEEDHEKLVEITEYSRQNLITENGLLCEQVAAYIFDDLPVTRSIDDHNEPPPPKPKPRPPPGFSNPGAANDHHHPLDVTLALPSLKNVRTVEELERILIKPPPANSLRLEDLERNLISKPAVQPVPIGQLLGQSPVSFLNLPPPPTLHTVLNKQIPKIPSIAPFPVTSPIPARPFVIPPGLVSNMNNVFMSLPIGPNRGVPSLNIPPPRIQSPLLPQPPEDEYAGLMTQKEKNWLASIQLLQLNTNQPYQEDYYYMMFQLRQSGAHGRKISNSLKNVRDRDTPSLIKPQYTPLQFENSLGKLQVGSVMAPRKIIDTDVVESVDSATPSTHSTKKSKQVLLEIEHMYALVLKAEDALSPLNAHPDLSVNPSDILVKVIRTLTKEHKLRTVLTVRKGKTLVLRILPHTGVSEPLVRNLILLLPSVANKDPEEAWLRALPSIRYYLGLCRFIDIIEFSTIFKPYVSSLVPNKFGISVIANMIERAEHFMFEGYESNEWLDFMSAVLGQVHSAESELERPVVGIHGPTLARHLSRCPANNQDVVALQKILSNMSMADKK